MTRPTNILLLRHAHSTANDRGILAGRDKTVGLSKRGVEESHLVKEHLTTLIHSGFTIDRIVVSPLLRVRETIAPFLTSNQGIEVVRDSGLIEMDYGSWSGKKLSLLSKRPLWEKIQQRPSAVRFPEGESFLEMAARSSEAVESLALPSKTTLFVSHGDVIKSIIAHHLGLHLDQFQRIAIEPASLSRISISSGRSTLISMNCIEHLRKVSSKEIDSTLGGGSGRR